MCDLRQLPTTTRMQPAVCQQVHPCFRIPRPRLKKTESGLFRTDTYSSMTIACSVVQPICQQALETLDLLPVHLLEGLRHLMPPRSITS